MAKNSQYRKSTTKAIENARKYGQKTYGYTGTTREELIKEYKRLAKVADQRLVRLESYKHDKGFSSVLKFAYSKAQYSIKSFLGDKATRFNVKIGEDVNTNEIRKRLNDVLTFLNSPTSTKQGIIKTYRERAKTLSETFGTSWTWEQLAQLAESGVFESSSFGYKTMLTVLSDINNMSKKKAINKVNSILEQHNKTYSDKIAPIGKDTNTFELQKYIIKLVQDGRLGQDELI